MSGKLFKTIDIDITKVKVTERARKDLGNLSSLKESIKDSGLFNPILVTKNYDLIAGERRLTACKELEFDEITVRIVPDDSADNLMLIEWMENIARKDFLWHEELDLRYKLHLYWEEEAKKQKKSWGYRETAAQLNCSLGGLSSDLALAKVLKFFPDLRTKETKRKARDAYKKIADEAIIIDSMQNRPDEEREKLSELMNGSYETMAKAKKAKKLDLPKAKHEDSIPDVTNISSSFTNEHDSTPKVVKKAVKALYAVRKYEEFIIDFPKESVGLVELDPPYAIGFNEIYGKVSKIKSKEKDWAPEQLIGFYEKYLPIIWEKLYNDSWVLVWTGHEYTDRINDLALKANFGIQKPGIWAKPSGSSNTPSTTMTSCYESFLLLRKGQAQFNTPSFSSVQNWNPVHTSGRVHQWEKPIDMYQHFIKAIGKPGAIAMSLFAGSGNFLLASAFEDMIPMGCDQSEKCCYSFYDKFEQHFNLLEG